MRQPRAVRTIRCHRVQSIGYGEDASSQRNFVALKAAWVTGSVILLLMSVNDLGCFRKKWNSPHNLVPAIAVLAHNGGLFGIEFSRLLKDLVRNGHLANVMQKGATRD